MVIAQGLFTILFTVRIYYTNNRNPHVKGFYTDKYLKSRLCLAFFNLVNQI